MTANETKDVIKEYIKCANSPCPNDDDPSCAECELLTRADEWDKALKTVVEILERRIPKKPKEEVVNDEIVALSCPICGSVVGYKGTTTRRIIRVYGRQICNRCGQAIY